MINKKLIILMLFIVSLLSLSAVSAADNATNDVVSVDQTTDEIAGDANDMTVASEDTIEKTNDDISELENQSDILESTDEGMVSIDENSWFYDDVVWYSGNYSGTDQVFLVLKDNENPENITVQLCHDANSQVIFDDENPGEYTIKYSECKNPIANVDLAILNNYNHKITKLTTDSNGIAIYNIPFKVEEFSFCVGFWYDGSHVANYANINGTTITAFNWGTWHNRTWINDSENNESIGEFGTFTELQNFINNASEGSTITLEKNYAYDKGFDTKGINISKPLTIDGNNHIIDANSKSKIFRINSDNIVLKNIIFKGGYSSSGGAIGNPTKNAPAYPSYNDLNTIFSAHDWEISSCKFINCRANDGSGGAISNSGSCTCNINSCNFINCSAMDTKDNPRGGGAIYGSGNCNINSCNFINCSANYGGGAISTDYDTTCNINSCNFTGCSAQKGGAIFTGDYGRGEYMANLYVENSIFTNNKASSDGGAIYISQSNLNVLNSIFSNNYGDAINADSFYYAENYASYPYSNEVSYHCNILIKDSNFTNNVKRDICGDDTTGKYIKIKNCIFDDNEKVSGAITSNCIFKTKKSDSSSSSSSSNSKNALTVKKVTPKLTAKNKRFKKKLKTKKYSVTLKTNKNKALAKVKLTLKIKMKTYKATTNAKGIATFKINKLTKKGNYKSTVTFAGNAYYNKVSKKVTITVK